MDLLILLIVGHVVGAVLGVGGATFIEINLNKALRDGEIDPVESSYLRITYLVTRIGLIVSLFSGIAILLLYRFEGQSFRFYDPTRWAKFTILAVIVVNSLLLQARKVPLWLGSSLSLVSWYAVLALGILQRGPGVPYLAIIFYYILSVLLGALILSRIRKMLNINI